MAMVFNEALTLKNST